MVRRDGRRHLRDRAPARLLDEFESLVSAFARSTNSEWLGVSVAGVGGVSNDGGEVRLASGLTGSTLHSWTGGTNDHMGRSVSRAGDLNQDGIADILFGANDAPFGAGGLTNAAAFSVVP